MSEACDTWGEENEYWVLVGKPEGSSHPLRHKPK
jgi:hypothetical protein